MMTSFSHQKHKNLSNLSAKHCCFFKSLYIKGSNVLKNNFLVEGFFKKAWCSFNFNKKMVSSVDVSWFTT